MYTYTFIYIYIQGLEIWSYRFSRAEKSISKDALEWTSKGKRPLRRQKFFKKTVQYIEKRFGVAGGR